MDSDAGGTTSDVGATALGVAMMRAQESAQPDALFSDPYAAAFVAAAPRPFEDIPDPDGQLARLEVAFRADVAIRTRFFDDFVVTASARGVRQVVLLAAGLDTRAFRLRLPSTMYVFELDRPGVLEFKDSILSRELAEPSCIRSVVPIDLRDDWPDALLHAGFRVDTPTAWTAEGLLAYLAPGDAVRIFDAVTVLSAPGSELAFEQASTSDDSTLAEASAASSMSEVASMWHDETSLQITGWLRENRWTTTTHDRADVARRYERAPGSTTARFVTATFPR